MQVKVVMPKWGTGMNEGTVTRWIKQVGDKVVEGEPLVEIETVKAVQELMSPATGTLKQIMLPVGESAEVRTTIAMIEEE